MNNKYINIEYKNKYHKYKNKYHNLCNKTKLKGGHAGLTIIGSIVFILIAIYFGYQYLPSNLKFREDVQKQIQDIQRVPIKKIVPDELNEQDDTTLTLSIYSDLNNLNDPSPELKSTESGGDTDALLLMLLLANKS